MSSYRFKPPQRRKRVYCKKEAPFPVPIESYTKLPAAQDNWYHYTGYLEGSQVVVKHSGDMDQLYRMGFFGKGNLSRHRPEYNRGGYWGIRKRRGLYGNEEVVKVVSRRRYLRHLAWKEAGSAVSGAPLGEESTELPKSKKLKLGQQVEAGSSMDMLESCDLTDQPGTSLEMHESIGQSHESRQSDAESDSDVRNSDSDWPQLQEEPSDWPIGSEDDPWAVGDTKASEEFWGLGSTADTKTEFKSLESENREQCIPSESHTQEAMETEQSTMGAGMGHKESDVFQGSQCTGVDLSSTQGPSEVDMPHNSSFCSQVENNTRSTANTSSEPVETQSLEKKNSVQPSASSQERPEIKTQKDDAKQAESETDPNLDPRCLIEESSGKLLVVDDSDDSDSEWSDSRTKWRPVRKHENVQIKEHLCLTLEEAFFLSYALGSLVVLDKSSVPLELCEMWRRFCSVQSSFPSHYAVYHHFRAKGWVPKVGIKFGADFILYKDGPPFYHSSYSVIIKTVNDLDLEPHPKYDTQRLTWRSLSAFNRVTEQVNKEVMLCYVLHPSTLTEAELSSPECIKQFKIQEMIVNRWVSSQEREQSDSDLPT